MLLATFSVAAQEIITQGEIYVPYQDTLFILRTVEVVNNDLTGLNDTVIRYVPPALDTAGLANLLFTRSVNAKNTADARWRAALAYRTSIVDGNTASALIATLGYNYDSLMVATYGNRHTGRYRLITSTENVLVDIEVHPTNSGLLRATRVGVTPFSRFNIRVRGANSLQLRLAAGNTEVTWDGLSAENRRFRQPAYIVPPSIQAAPAITLTKLR